MTNRLLPLSAVIAQVGLRKTTIYALIKAGTFPKQIYVGASALWSEAEVQVWIAARLAERDDERAAS